MEHLANRVVSSWPRLIVRGAGEVHKRPGVAAVLYAVALAGVLASPFGGGRRSLGAPGRRGGRGNPAAGGAPEPAEASVLRELERAGLRVLERDYGPGDEVYTPGDPADRLYFLLSGVVRTYRIYGDSKEATTALLNDAGVFGVLDLAEGEGGSHEEFAEAVTNAQVASVRKAALAWLVRRKPEVSLALFSAFSKRVRQTDDLLGSLLQREVAGRLAALLLILGERFGEEGDEASTVTIGLRLAHRQLASMIASTREAVSKAMADLRREGLIDVRERRSIVLLDLPGLSERAEGGPST